MSIKAYRLYDYKRKLQLLFTIYIYFVRFIPGLIIGRLNKNLTALA